MLLLLPIQKGTHFNNFTTTIVLHGYHYFAAKVQVMLLFFLPCHHQMVNCYHQGLGSYALSLHQHVIAYSGLGPTWTF